MNNVFPMASILKHAHNNGYAVGSFSPRSTLLIEPIIIAAMQMNSPLLIQISEKELLRHEITLGDFSKRFYDVVEQLNPQIPIGLHLDHTSDIAIIKEAIACKFTSVMIDASRHCFEENLSTTKEVVSLAKPAGVSVEAELGRIGTTDMVETTEDITQLTDSNEAYSFILQSNIDALAVSVGTSHGPYVTSQPKIVYSIIEQINALTDTPLVLHGGSGVPPQMLIRAISMNNGGISKVNIATDLEVAATQALCLEGHLKDSEYLSLDSKAQRIAKNAVQALVADKIVNFLLSNNQGSNSLTFIQSTNSIVYDKFS